MTSQNVRSRGAIWFSALTGNTAPAGDYPASVLVADATLADQPARFITIVPDAENRFPRVRNGEVGLVEGWSLARAVHEVIAQDRDSQQPRPIVVIVDVASQAYGRREEAYGIHQALAGAAGAYAQARLAGHPVISLIVGKAMSGAFLAHGYQANRLIALNDPGVLVHAMGKAAAARITQRSVADLESFAATVPPMAYDIANYHTLGLLWKLLDGINADAPASSDVAQVNQTLLDALADIRAEAGRDLKTRLGGENRQASSRVREMLSQQW
jgi:malonate decarboxylase gamma subunit